jgi:hypothetical protein
MASPKFIEIDGKRFVWRDILQRRREQRMTAARIEQPALFELQGRLPARFRAHPRRSLSRTQPVRVCRAGPIGLHGAG